MSRWPHWERFPNLDGRDRGPIYRKVFGEGSDLVLAFTLRPHWRRADRREPMKSKVKDASGFRLVRDGYEIEGLPEIRSRGGRMPRTAATLAEAKGQCERFAFEVAAGQVDPVTGDKL